MRYPLWAFFFVLVMPIFAAHALLTGKAGLRLEDNAGATSSAFGAPAYWTHTTLPAAATRS